MIKAVLKGSVILVQMHRFLVSELHLEAWSRWDLVNYLLLSI